MKGAPRLIVLFTAGAALLYLLFNAMVISGVSKSAKGQLGKVNRICNHENTPAIAIFGSSVGEVGINAPLLQAQTGLSVFNFSIDGTRFQQYKGLIDEFASNNNTTKFVVLTETYFSFAKVDALTEPERYLANISNNNVYKSLYSIQPDMIWKSRYVPFYKYTLVSHTFYMAAMDGWKRRFKNTGTDSLAGYTPVYRNWEADQDSIMKKLKPFSIETDASVIAAYKDCISRLRAKGIQVLIVLPPVYMTVLKTKTDFTPLRTTLRSVAKESNCVFWDFSESRMCDDKSFFYNSNHLNSKGAGNFGLVLADSIKQLAQNIKKEAAR